MKKIFFTATAFFLAFSLHAQFVYDYLKAADNYYQKGDYYSAAQYYEKYFGSDKAKDRPQFNPYVLQAGSKKTAPAAANREQATWQLAECYRKLNFPSKAEPYYKEAMEMGNNKFPLATYHYATIQRALGKYAESEKAFTDFLSVYTTDDEYRKGAEREIKNLQYIQAQLQKKDLKYYTVNKAPEGLNSKGGNYAPAWLNATTLLFTSTRPDDTTAKDKSYINHVYEAVYTEGVLADVKKTDISQGKDIHQGVTTALPGGSRLFFTRWTIGKDHHKTSTIYSSAAKANGWSDPDVLDASINTPGFNTQQPFVTADGKYLLFASDRPGGYGGFDLWYAELDASGKPGPVMNMGNVINTPQDEQAPFYHEASKMLVFSCNGRIGMGGYDFFYSKGTIGSFNAPENFGYPVNSIKDDIYFTSRGGAKNILEDVLLSSDRDAACCLELFYLKKIRPLRKISGRIVSCDPSKSLAGATVTITDANNKTVFTKAVDADGSYSFTLEDYLNVKVKGDATGFFSNSVDVDMPADMEQEGTTYPDLCLQPEPPQVNETFVVENVYYDFNKSSLKPESYPALDEIVRMLNTYPAMVIELGAHTDNIGSNAYNQKLSEARAKSVVAYLVSKGIDESRLRAKGYGETMPIEPNKKPNGSDNPDGREKNRRTEFKVLEN